MSKKTTGQYLNEGNFRALLRYRAEGDELLKKNLLSTPKNATYLSKTIQNEIIETCHEVIRKKIVDKINQSKGFSVLADESTDISSIEQFSICVRYLDSEPNICEDFLGFVPVTDVSGQALAKSIKNYLIDIGVDCSFMYGQGYDGAPAMSGEFHGAQAYLRSFFPLAIYVHCAAHSFSLTINAACEVSGIKNALGTVGSIQAFFHWPKRQSILKNEIAKMTKKSEQRREKLKSICPTRWAQSHEAVSTYVELQPAVIEALEEIKTWRDRETSSLASQLLTAIFTVEFQISCQIMESINSLVLPLSRELQLKNQDLGEATKLADDALNDFKEKRENVNSYFHIIYEKVSEICSEYEIEMKTPRRCERQKYRCNIETQTVEDYYKLAFYIPFLDTYICHLESRFQKHKIVFQSFGQLFLKQEYDEKKCASLYQFYEEVLDCSESNFISEVKMWRQRIHNQNIENALDALSIMNNETFKNVNKMLRILAVLPVTTATPERSFSTLRRIKDYLRNTMVQERLNGLASLNIHHHINITEEEILRKFFEKPRKFKSA
ncbi:52 kDa repressor of the inhibitor of the protein kinase-like [Daktulosphaira vitifoliae]|nr:52 kDa repressor of the inhibitor of the protein kinase-like [Daktulosphaira vitifoliae]